MAQSANFVRQAIIGRTLFWGASVSFTSFSYYHWDELSRSMGRGIGKVIKGVFEVDGFQESNQILKDNHHLLATHTANLLANQTIRQKVLELCEWIVEQLADNKKIHESVAKILISTLNSDAVSEQAAWWIIEILKREDVGQGTREALIKSVLQNSIMKEEASKTAQSVIEDSLNSPITFEGGKDFLLSVLRDPDIQKDASMALWGVLKKSILGGTV